MPNEIKKVSGEQLKKLQDLQRQFDILTKRLGELHFQKKIIFQEFERVDYELDKLNGERNAEVLTLQQHFGSPGTIDLSTGEFIPEQ